MSDAALPHAPSFRPQLAAVGVVGSGLVTLGVFLSGFVISEPAPYEVFMAALIGLWALVGLRISRTVAPLLALLMIFNIGGMLSLTVMDDLSEGPMYMAVSLFLAISSVFFAAIVEAKPARLQLIFRAWVGSALITSMLGILGYFLPGLVLTQKVRKKMREYRNGFPDFMDLMIVCSDAGMSMEAGIERVSKELQMTYPSLAENLQRHDGARSARRVGAA